VKTFGDATCPKQLTAPIVKPNIDVASLELVWDEIKPHEAVHAAPSNLWRSVVPSPLDRFVQNCKARHDEITADITLIAIVTRLSRFLETTTVATNSCYFDDEVSLKLNTLVIDDSDAFKNSFVYFCEDKYLQQVVRHEQKVKMINRARLPRLNQGKLSIYNNLAQLQKAIEHDRFSSYRTLALPTNLSILTTHSFNQLLDGMSKKFDESLNDMIQNLFDFIVVPEGTTSTNNNEELDLQSLDAIEQIFYHIAASHMSPLQYCLFFGIEAQMTFDTWASELGSNRMNLILCAKLAGIFHIISKTEALGNMSNLDMSTEIDAEHVGMAIALVDETVSHQQKLESMIVSELDAKCADALLDRLNDLTNPFSMRQLQRKQWKGLTSKQLCEDAVRNLIKCNYIQEKRYISVNNKSITRYYINPAF
jgi:hypothetical protein